jgi:alkylation response protein AidB-like acyl-CoA dehydrogenase
MSYGVVLLARTEDSTTGRPRFGNFIVEKGAEGYTWGQKLQGIGWRGLDTRQLFFSDVFVPDDQVLGEVGTGLGQFLSTLEVGRISVAALANSLSKAVLAMAIEYANQRSQFGSKIGSYQAIQFKLATIATELEASRWLTYRAAQLRDSGAPFRKEAAMAKLQASRVAMRAASEAVQVFGGIGYMLETPVARFFCDAKVLEIGEGTNEIQQIVIAREIGCGAR